MTGTNGKANGNGSDPSALDWLRARHAELSQDRSMDYAVPGYAGRLVLRFGPAQWRAIAKAQNVNGPDDNGQALLNANSDVIISATRAVLVKDPDSGELVSIGGEGDPVRFDARLAELLGSETGSARELLLWLFPSEVTIGVCAGALLEWTQGADQETTEAFIQG